MSQPPAKPAVTLVPAHPDHQVVLLEATWDNPDLDCPDGCRVWTLYVAAWEVISHPRAASVAEAVLPILHEFDHNYAWVLLKNPDGSLSGDEGFYPNFPAAQRAFMEQLPEIHGREQARRREIDARAGKRRHSHRITHDE